MQKITPYLEIARFDHWFKNVFCIPGMILAIYFSGLPYQTWEVFYRVVVGLLSVGFVASANYTINEILDADYDKEHPVKCQRPIPSGQVNIFLAYVQYVVLTCLSFLLSFLVGEAFLLSTVFLWVMGVVYNVKPLRLKEWPYLDAITESINNPIRMALGWYMIHPKGLPTLSILLAYWMLGAYFMSLKRYAEYRLIDNPDRASAYRASFRFTNARKLLIVSVLYGNAFCIMYGVFITKFRFELIFTLPLIGAFVAIYLAVALKDNSPVQNPEKLYREKNLMMVAALSFISSSLLMFWDMPNLRTLFDM